jgi:magnesium transporter
MDPSLTPTPSMATPRPPRSSHSSSSRKHPPRRDYPLSTDNNASYAPMSGGRAPETGPASVSETTTSETRFHPPADSAPGKPSKSSKKKKNRNRKRRNRHQSFLTPDQENPHDLSADSTAAGGVRDSMEADRPPSRDNPSYFKLGRNLSNTSLESDALLDHR